MSAIDTLLNTKEVTDKGDLISEGELGLLDKCAISFIPKRLSSDNLVAEQATRQRNFWFCFKRADILSTEMINSYMLRICKYCLTHRVDSYQIHLDRLKGAKLIRKVARRINYNDLTMLQIVSILWSSMSVVHHFYIRLIPISGSYKAWYRRRQYNFALVAYMKVLLMLLPAMFSTVVQSIVTFFHESKSWNLESLVTILIDNLLEAYKDNELVVYNILEIIKETESKSEVKNVLKVLERLLVTIDWKRIEGPVLDRLLELYKESAINIELISLRSSYEACIRHALKKMHRLDVLKVMNTIMCWITTSDESSAVEYGNLLEQAAKLHDKNENYYTSITKETLKLVLELVASDLPQISILGNRVLYFLLQNQDNSVILLTPKFFFQDVVTNLTRGEFNVENKRFLQDHHTIIQAALMASIYKHGNSRVILECIFANVAVIVVEVPCGYTAAAGACLIMGMQEFALDDSSLTIDNFYRIHACVMYIMSLICYVHNATIFYDYVNTILSKRAQMAPQMNPPLRLTYRDLADSWKRSELYFEDWEVRYGLWKCFIQTTTY